MLVHKNESKPTRTGYIKKVHEIHIIFSEPICSVNIWTFLRLSKTSKSGWEIEVIRIVWSKTSSSLLFDLVVKHIAYNTNFYYSFRILLTSRWRWEFAVPTGERLSWNTENLEPWTCIIWDKPAINWRVGFFIFTKNIFLS